jgi:hypothetical protein
MVKEKTKDITLGGNQFRLTKISAIDGSALLRLFTSRGKISVQQFVSNLTTEQFSDLQRILLSKIFRLEIVNEKEALSPVYIGDGMIDPKIEDAQTIFMLTIISLSFNLSGFFEESTLKEFGQIMDQFNV